MKGLARKGILFLIITTIAGFLFCGISFLIGYLEAGLSEGIYSYWGKPMAFLYMDYMCLPNPPCEEFYPLALALDIFFWYLASTAIVLTIDKAIRVRKSSQYSLG